MDFGAKKGETYFGTNFAHLDILENFDSISMSWISGQKRRKVILGPILSIWIFWKTLTALVCHGFRSKKGESYFGTNFVQLDILKNFDSISMSKKAWHFLKSPQNVSSSPAQVALRRRFGDFDELLTKIMHTYFWRSLYNMCAHHDLGIQKNRKKK